MKPSPRAQTRALHHKAVKRQVFCIKDGPRMSRILPSIPRNSGFPRKTPRRGCSPVFLLFCRPQPPSPPRRRVDQAAAEPTKPPPPLGLSRFNRREIGRRSVSEPLLLARRAPASGPPRLGAKSLAQAAAPHLHLSKWMAATGRGTGKRSCSREEPGSTRPGQPCRRFESPGEGAPNRACTQTPLPRWLTS